MITDGNTINHVRLLTRHTRQLAARKARLRRNRIDVAGNLTHLACVDAAIRRLTDEIDHRQYHFRVGDFARIGGAWYPVLHAGWTALAVPPPEHVRCTCQVTIPTFNAEFVPDQDGGPCTDRPVARLTIRHDGAACACHGLCLIADGDPAVSALRAPWVEVVPVLPRPRLRLHRRRRGGDVRDHFRGADVTPRAAALQPASPLP